MNDEVLQVAGCSQESCSCSHRHGILENDTLDVGSDATDSPSFRPKELNLKHGYASGLFSGEVHSSV